ncbi:hypothetical protein ACLB1G_12425 [Oxalobacteraceae bacterium A2-2]
MRACDLNIVGLNEGLDAANWTAMPTVALLLLSRHPERLALARVVSGALAAGTILFAAYGPLAGIIEEEIDALLEDEGRFDVVTTSHYGETVEDVANFVLHAACPKEERFRCLVILDQPTPESEQLLRELER